jgi:hypothetical protein
MLHPSRVYQFPFFMGGIIASFLIPQAYTLVYYSNRFNSEALDRTLIAASLCTVMCYVGYRVKPAERHLNLFEFSLDEDKLFKAGVILTIVGYVFRSLMLAVPESETGGSMWTGRVTIFAFFYGVINVAFVIMMTQALRRPKVSNIIWAVIAGFPPFGAAFLTGRRAVVASFILTIGLAVFFVRRYVVPRGLAFAMVLLATVLMPLVGQYRGEWLGKTSELAQTSQVLSVEDRPLELRNAVYLMDAVASTGQYEYGAGYWNSTVFRFVPAQILSREFKESLQFGGGDYDLSYLYGYNIPVGTTNTGIADTYVQFGYFGCLVYALLAFLFKILWVSLVRNNNLVSYLFYVSLITSAMLAVTHGTLTFLPDLIYNVIFLGLVIVYARVDKPRGMKVRLTQPGLNAIPSE